MPALNASIVLPDNATNSLIHVIAVNCITSSVIENRHEAELVEIIGSVNC